MPIGPKMPPYPLRLYKINFSSEYGHTDYEIKGNEVHNNMLANIFLFHLPLIPGVGLIGEFVMFAESSNVV